MYILFKMMVSYLSLIHGTNSLFKHNLLYFQSLSSYVIVSLSLTESVGLTHSSLHILDLRAAFDSVPLVSQCVDSHGTPFAHEVLSVLPSCNFDVLASQSCSMIHRQGPATWLFVRIFVTLGLYSHSYICDISGEYSESLIFVFVGWLIWGSQKTRENSVSFFVKLINIDLLEVYYL